MRFARVLVLSHVQNLDKLFDYVIPDSLDDVALPGIRAVIPFNRRDGIGLIWEITRKSEYPELKEIIKLLDERPLLTDVQLQLVDWLARYYFCNRAEVVKLCLPPGIKGKNEYSYSPALSLTDTEQILNAKFSMIEVETILTLLESSVKRQWTHETWLKKLKNEKLLNFLIKHGILKKNLLTKNKINPKKIELFQWTAVADIKETAAGNRVKEVLRTAPEGMTKAELTATASVSTAVINRLLQKKALTIVEKSHLRQPAGFDVAVIKKEIYFNDEQRSVLEAIRTAQTNNLFLLHGITGSGKTEIYFELAAETLKQGRQVLYLVPEIALTPQTLERARNRFEDQVALLHSNMSDGERFDQWFRIKRKEAGFVLGARSAIFAPFAELGLIIMDEEHETTYKQEESPRYHSRQVVEKLAEISGAKVIFGSATPAVESFYAARTNKYLYLELKKRHNNNPLPEVTMVDMREELRRGNKNILSNLLYQSLADTLKREEQAIILLNRRGHSTFVLCRDCGQALRCPSCDVSLTYHLQENILRCHYCDYRRSIPNICPNCHSHRIRYFGHGTQKLEAELLENFKSARIIRMDLDTTGKKDSHYRIYRELAAGKVDILLGTQMVAKGLDLPRVTLVGVISADSTLNLPDFRSAERCFQILTQAAGRAGRGNKIGRVIFQTYNPEHYALVHAKGHNYTGFYEREIKNREELGYPPYTELLKIGFSGFDQAKVEEAAEFFGKIIREEIAVFIPKQSVKKERLELLGPAPALIPKISNRYYWQIIIKSCFPDDLETVIQNVWERFPVKKYPDLRIIRDRNPYSVL